MRLIVREPRIAAEAKIGDSIALNGCCLTVVGIDGDRLSFPGRRGNAVANQPGRTEGRDFVNLEQSLRAGDPIGGHYVTGHIDAVGTVAQRDDDADWCTMWFRAAAPIRQMASKGSIAVDGVA